MTLVITRYFATADAARAVQAELIEQQRFKLKILDLFTDAEGLAAKLTDAHVQPDTARVYQDRMAGGGAVLLVRAGYKPLGVAQIFRDVTASMGGPELPGLTEEVYLKDPPDWGSSILEDHPYMMTVPRVPGSTNYHMAAWPIPLISRRKPYRGSLFPIHMRMAAFPVPLLDDRKPYTKSIFPRHARMARFPIPLLSDRKPYTGSIIPPHARMANFPIPLISKRKPFDKSLFPRHQRMATVPFPLLMNGKTGTNALMPGAPRMANFPIPLLSDRKPFTGSIIPRHGRMARFPIPLISTRKPFTGSIIPRHGRMADFILPLIIRREDEPSGGRKGFSFSRLFGLPTLSKR